MPPLRLKPAEERGLRDLLGAITGPGPSLPGDEAWSQFQSIVGGAEDRIAATRAARSDLLGQLGTTAQEAALSGMSQGDLSRILTAQQLQSGVKTGPKFDERLGGIVTSLYGGPPQFASQMDQQMPGGLSPLAGPQIGFDMSDVQAINESVRALKLEGLSIEEIEQQIFSQLQSKVDANGNPVIDPLTGAPEIDEAGAQFISQHGNLISSAIRNAYVAAPGMPMGAEPPLRSTPAGVTQPAPAEEFPNPALGISALARGFTTAKGAIGGGIRGLLGSLLSTPGGKLGAGFVPAMAYELGSIGTVPSNFERTMDEIEAALERGDVASARGLVDYYLDFFSRGPVRPEDQPFVQALQAYKAQLG